MAIRICKTCRVSKLLDSTNFYFHRDREYFSPHCKECTREKLNTRYANDKDFRERHKARISTPEYRERTNARLRERRATDPQYRNDQNARRRERRASDRAYRDRQNARVKERRASDREFRERLNSRRREKYHNNLEFRNSILEQQRQKRANSQEYRDRQNARQREKRASDPEVREKERRRWREDPEYRNRKLNQQKHRWHNDPRVRAKTRARKQLPEVRAKENARNKERWAKNPAFREAQRAKQHYKYHNDPIYRQSHENRVLTRLYGITKADYEDKKSTQQGLCAICQRRTKLSVDHNHRTGQVRGLLCLKCNNAIGFFEENRRIMIDAVAYLKGPSMIPLDIPTTMDEYLFARFEIPNWEVQSRDKQFRRRKTKNLRRYGISLDQYEWLLATRNGCCWVCRRPETRKRQRKARYPESLYVDHEHSSGMIRGLLCRNCNTAIGYLGDNAETLTAAVKYLEGWSGSTDTMNER